MPARFRLYGFARSVPTYKVALMLALSHEPFSFRSVNLGAGEQKHPAYVAKSRFGQVPCLEDLSNGRHLVQSAAILDYLADKLGKFGGATLDERLDAREWLFWSFDRLATYVFRLRAHSLGIRAIADDVVTDFRGMAAMALTTLNQHLTGRSWMVGEGPTFADIEIYAVLSAAGDARIDLADYPMLSAFMARFEALPGFAPRLDLVPAADRDL